MMKQVLLATAMAVGLSSFALAQDAPPPPAPPQAAPMGAPAGGPGGPGGPAGGPLAASPAGDMRPAPGDLPPPPPPPRPGMGPQAERRGPPPPPPLAKGVEVRMGKHAGFRVECGDEPMQACLAAAKPLTDRLATPPAPPAPPIPGGQPTPPAN